MGVTKKGEDAVTLSTKFKLSKQLSLSDEKGGTVNEEVITLDDEDEDEEPPETPLHLCPPTHTKISKHWGSFLVFDLHKHPEKKDFAACNLCFEKNKWSKTSFGCTSF